VGGYIVIDDGPCKIIKMAIHKTGKHGHCKIHFIATNIFTSKKIDLIETSTHNVDSCDVDRRDYQLVNIDDDYLSFMNEQGEMKEDIRMPLSEELRNGIQDAFDQGKEVTISVLKAMDIEEVVDWKSK